MTPEDQQKLEPVIWMNVVRLAILALLVLVAGVSAYLYSKSRGRGENYIVPLQVPGSDIRTPIDISGWELYYNSDFSFSFLHPDTCQVRATTDNPYAKVNDYVVFDCSDELLNTMIIIAYTNLFEDYIPERLSNPQTEKTREYVKESGEKVLELYTKQYNLPGKSVVSYVNRVGSDVTLEIYGPQIAAPKRIIDIYRAIVESIRLEASAVINTSSFKFIE